MLVQLHVDGTYVLRPLQTVQPSVKELLFQTKDLDESYQGKLNIMTTVFLLLQTRSELTETVNELAFSFGNRLLMEFFDEHLQVSVCCVCGA